MNNKFYTERPTRTVDFVLAPSDKYVGWCIYNNAYYFGSANTLSRLLHNVNQSIYKAHKMHLSLSLASKQTDRKDVPVDKMTNNFKIRSYFAHGITGFLTEEQAEIFERMKPKVEPKPAEKINEEFVCEERDGMMVIYKLVEVNRYKLHKGANDVNSEN